MEVNIYLEITPPKGASKDETSPNSFLMSSPVARAIKRKTGLDLKENDAKRICFAKLAHGEVKDNAELMKCREKGEKVGITMPFAPVADLQQRVTDTEERLKTVKEEVNTLKEEVKILEEEREHAEKTRLVMFVYNLLSDFVKKVYAQTGKKHLMGTDKAQQSVDPGHARIVSAAKRITEKDLKQCKVDTKYLAIIAKMDQYHAARNETAHESETEFARLLDKARYRSSGSYDRWSPLFVYTYGKTVEQMLETRTYKDLEL
ncbi:MAG: hypothetical protein M1832_003185 [Thelocarpon impressellum]|nr:MAG: hypothetical protein M1832_003185 [Thelocarpon impressellum]